MTNDQVETLASAIRNVLSFERADAFEHVFGPAKCEFSVAYGINAMASAIGEVAEAIRELACEVQALRAKR